MSKTAPIKDESEITIRIHEKNYELFKARSEKDVNTSIQSSLKMLPYLSAYYTTTETGLELGFSYDPQTQKAIKGIQKTIEISPIEMARCFSESSKVTKLANADISPALVSVFQEAGCDSLAVIPAIEDVISVGVIFLGATEAQEIDQKLLSPVVNLAETIPHALENIKAARATQQRLRELEAISETSQLVSSSSNLQDLYEVLHKQIKETIGEVNFAVGLYDPETQTIAVPYLYDQESINKIDPFPLGEGLISILLRTRQPLMLVDDTERRARALGAKFVGRAAKSWLGCPLVIGGEAVGAIIVQDLEKENRFNQEDLRFITSLSAQVGGAINNTRLLESARKRALQLQTVAEISREVSSSLIVDNLLRQAVQLACERFDFYHAAVFLLDDAKEFALIREATGEAGSQMKRAGHKLAVGSKSIVGYVAENNESLVVNDTSSDPNYYANPLMPETRAEAALPLRVGSEVIGVMDVQSSKPFVFNEENVKIMQILADQMAVAVVNSQLFAEAQERLSQHRLLHHVTTAAASSTTIEEALNSAVQGLQVTLGGDQISILLSDKEQKNLDVRASIGYPNEESAKLKIPFGVGITGWVAAHRLPLRVNDVTKDSRYISVNSKIRSELSIPLIYRNEVLGVLNVESPRTFAYSENDEEMLGTLAGSLAAIIAHSRLLEQFRTQVDRERMLYEIINKIRRTSSADRILSIAADEIGKVLTAKRVAIKVDLPESENF
ncbi:MAG: GAF domain-containing protein [Anaerolineales bacterium]|jgi:GAF domain-containing protein|nr:GAF domain-containing protein [Anaerolineales bacterium]